MTHLPDKPTNGEGRSNVSIPDHDDSPVLTPESTDTEAEPSALTALLARVEAAEGPDRELDALIWIAIGPRPMGDNFSHWIHDWSPGWELGPEPGYVYMVQNGSDFKSPPFTASLDAAIALCERMLPGWTIANINQDDTKRWWSELREGHQTSYNRVAISGPRPTPALLAAILTAKIAEAASPADRQT